MKTLKLDLQNCYGIKSLKHEFDFSRQGVVAVYAPNGAMKTSLAKTFMDVSRDTDSRDQIFVKRPSTRTITEEGGVPLDGKKVFVIEPYAAEFGHSEKTSILLVNKKLRKEFEALRAQVDAANDVLLKNLKKLSGSKRDLEKEISATFMKSDDKYFTALGRVEKEVLKQTDTPFSEIPYDVLFDEKVVEFLSKKDFKTAIRAYIEKYNQLIEASTYFKKGVFNYYNAAKIAKSLAENGFFAAKHSVILNAKTKTIVSTEKDLEKLIEDEKRGITNDETLKKKFAEIEKLIQANVALRSFNELLLRDQGILPELENLDLLKEKVWKSYLVSSLELFKDLMAKHQETEKRQAEIRAEATRERTLWESTIEIFNDRFSVPFKVEAKNRTAVILGEEPMLTLSFTFDEGGEQAIVAKDNLLQVLSMGEKKALYILNIIFEVEARRQAQQETVFIFDDIADSFDYKNKYAIVEYLKEISEDPCFRQIILTHNFDFFRTVNSRFVGYPQCFMTCKTSAGLTLNKAEGIKNVFVNDWKPNFYGNARKRVASIPFIRNIIEYTKGEGDPDYQKLTSLLHWKKGSDGITQDDLAAIYSRLFGESGTCPDGARKIAEVIFSEATDCLGAPEGINFENKIVLSIAVRLAAEKYMVSKIGDEDAVFAIAANQARELFKLFKAKADPTPETLGVIERVMLMTPENIHLNSFMYEPILDMSDEHLRKLYRDVQALG